jgi:A/G-specific adenine glycosylase
MSKGQRQEADAPKAGDVVRVLLKWFQENARDLPWRRTRDPYAIWISEIMLQQTQVKTVIPYWKRWMRHLKNVPALARARPDSVLKLWEGLGYYLRASNLQKAARIIVDQHEGQFPEQFDEVLALPGIGRYTAGAICSIAFDQPTPVLDGNARRVITRLFGIVEDPRQKETNARLWKLAQDLVEAAARRARPGERNCSNLNQSLMDLGAVICTVRQPKCPRCPVRTRCVALRERRTALISSLGKRIPSTRRRFVAFVVERNRHFLVRRRAATVVNGRLWEFPNLEAGWHRADERRLAEQLLGTRPARVWRLQQVRHAITRYRITTDVYRVEFANESPRAIENAQWRSLSELRKLAFPSAHRKILEILRTNL